MLIGSQGSRSRVLGLRCLRVKLWGLGFLGFARGFLGFRAFRVSTAFRLLEGKGLEV